MPAKCLEDGSLGRFGVGHGFKSREGLGSDDEERLFSEIAKMDFPELEERKVCVSAGAAFYKAGGKHSFEELYKLADSGVYESKKIDGSAVTFR